MKKLFIVLACMAGTGFSAVAEEGPGHCVKETKTQTAVDTLCEAAYSEKSILRQTAELRTVSSAVSDANASQDGPSVGYISVKNRAPKHTFHANAGYGWLASGETNLFEGSGSEENGIAYTAGYQYSWYSGVGIGLYYAGFYAGYDESGTHIDLSAHYIAAEVSYKYARLRKWIFSVATGCGYIRRYETLCGSIGGFGGHFSLGCDYKISRRFGVGINGTIYETVMRKSGKLGGAVQLSVTAGLRLYL